MRSPISNHFADDSQYFIVQRSILQSMPETWQTQFRGMLEYLAARIPEQAPTEFLVFALDTDGQDRDDKYAKNPDGRRQVTLRSVAK